VHVGDRFRSAWARLRGRDDAVAGDDLGTPWMLSFDETHREHRDMPARRRGEVTTAEREEQVARALGRVADTFARIADSLDADRRDRRVQFEADRRDRRTQLDAVEFLLREMAIGVSGATAVPPVVVGGSIDPDALRENARGEVQIDLSDAPIELDAEVEVRSRFHDGWVHGFTVAGHVDTPEGYHYRLRRLSEGEPLPMLYAPADVRRASVTTEPPPLPRLPRASRSDG
jgi:hypothetical protein